MTSAFVFLLAVFLRVSCWPGAHVWASTAGKQSSRYCLRCGQLERHP